ncbi:TetR/AcrR family transcriptional regulator [Nocardioides mangrovicus]|uniref:TetR/AcrR family transcriptional regulator n=1 Tax=Nocardioides mangrovicus TaxID=2478913 RepID=A0A3L8NZE6_9ACTN|nr:TetR/AcrR family transcriptional regulator [Nocardioides mangrovicus]RLV47468.1 TetR/AcrR family transcriptional regulator [Nocardioides mangrovicus]
MGNAVTRQRMVGSADVRASRTRAKLVDAFAGLAELPEPVTVSALVRRAGVNRTSFYAHFASLDALAVETLTEVFDLVASIDTTGRGCGHDAETSEKSLLEVARFVGARREVYGPLLRSGDFYQAVEDAFTAQNVRTLSAVRDLPDDVDPFVLARFVAAGALGVVASWLREGNDLSAQWVAVQLRRVLPAWFTTDSPVDEASPVSRGDHHGKA